MLHYLRWSRGWRFCKWRSGNGFSATEQKTDTLFTINGRFTYRHVTGHIVGSGQDHGQCNVAECACKQLRTFTVVAWRLVGLWAESSNFSCCRTKDRHIEWCRHGEQNASCNARLHQSPLSLKSNPNGLLCVQTLLMSESNSGYEVPYPLLPPPAMSPKYIACVLWTYAPQLHTNIQM